MWDRTTVIILENATNNSSAVVVNATNATDVVLSNATALHPVAESQPEIPWLLLVAFLLALILIGTGLLLWKGGKRRRWG